MKRAASLITVVLLVILSQAVPALADSQAESEATLVGEYVWNQGASGDLKAVFKPTGDGTYDVSFSFDFRDQPHTYSGTATGSLDGEISGEVRNESRERTFTFEGSFKDGVFEGNHSETTPGRAGRTGTLRLES